MASFPSGGIRADQIPSFDPCGAGGFFIAQGRVVMCHVQRSVRRAQGSLRVAHGQEGSRVRDRGTLSQDSRQLPETGDRRGNLRAGDSFPVRRDRGCKARDSDRTKTCEDRMAGLCPRVLQVLKRHLALRAELKLTGKDSPPLLQGGRCGAPVPGSLPPVRDQRGGSRARCRADDGLGWRRERDSNPRRAFGPYTLSRGAPSTTRPSLRASAKYLLNQALKPRATAREEGDDNARERKR